MTTKRAAEHTLTDNEIYLFNEGRYFNMPEKLGAHATKDGVHFSVWAPNAERVSVIGDFNGWEPDVNTLQPQKTSGIWSTFVAGAKPGARYKFSIKSSRNNYAVEKADPFAFRTEVPPNTASIVWKSEYQWTDRNWMKKRGDRQALTEPVSVYEMHLGSWRRHDDGSYMSYRDLAATLPGYLSKLGFTHVELLPVMEHPFYGSWGYQTTGYFAPTSRYGSPDDFKHLIDKLHQQDIGVILDWVPSHFPSDEFALSYFDGTHLFEHQDPRQGYHPDWNSLIFNYGRNEVRSFLIANALFWLDEYHIDGLRIDAVASMLYLDYSRKEGEWIPNEYGGRENIEAIRFLRELNEVLYAQHPDIQTIAEESTAWPMVSRPVYLGGLGFGMKWDMGWMHDTLSYFQKDPIYRKHHQDELTFRMVYAFNENFMLSLSHDEVVYGKGSMLNKMPGDRWQKFANLRALYAYMYAQPGKKLMFMGMEFGQESEWAHEGQLEWSALDNDLNRGLLRLVKDLNHVYKKQGYLSENDFSADGFRWVDTHDHENSVLSFLRKGADGGHLLVVLNLTPMVRGNYRVGVPFDGYWQETLNTDAEVYGGSGQGNFGGVATAPVCVHDQSQSLNLTLPPLSAVFFEYKGEP